MLGLKNLEKTRKNRIFLRIFPRFSSGLSLNPLKSTYKRLGAKFWGTNTRVRSHGEARDRASPCERLVWYEDAILATWGLSQVKDLDIPRRLVALIPPYDGI